MNMFEILISKKGFFIFILLNLCLLFILINLNLFSIKSFFKNYISSHKFIINNNLAQYSSYILKNDEDKYVIEVYIFFLDHHRILGHDNVKNYLCLVKLNQIEETIELKAIKTHRYQTNYNRKLIF